MSSVTVRERDPVKEANRNLLFNAVLFLPFLFIFGFSLFNVATATLFLVLAGIRFVFPYNETLRAFEMVSALVLTVVWLVVTIL